MAITLTRGESRHESAKHAAHLPPSDAQIVRAIQQSDSFEFVTRRELLMMFVEMAEGPDGGRWALTGRGADA